MKVIMIGVPVVAAGGVVAGVVVHRNQVEETTSYQTAEEYETVRDAQSVEMLEIASKVPNYAQIRKIEFIENDFERTPKRNIKRYLYQKNK